MTTMPKCRNCNYDVHPSIGQCPHCGAPMDKPNADLEQQVRLLLDQGQKIAAVKLYKDQTGVGLAEAKQAVESLAARHGLETQRAGCLGVVLAAVLAAVSLGVMTG
jgi:ribosomal protein L7/L12